LKAQAFKEWFEQKKTQIEYLVNQIAALQVYTNTIEKGYSISHEGLTIIGNIKKGDFSLHSDYFSSLNRVNPTIKSYWKIADIIQTEVNIIKSYNWQNKLLRNSGLFTSDEVKYCSSVFTNLLGGCNDIIDQLMAIITDGQLQMKDDERIERIDDLHVKIKDKERFIQSFGSEISMLTVQRVTDQNDVKVLRSLLGIE
ncbi:MAG: hypothetical protein J7497_17465, partial [Chitinophagaceae bacterium]|nr:hypothetical protein [Chitinophagaceae bacterium]